MADPSFIVVRDAEKQRDTTRGTDVAVESYKRCMEAAGWERPSGEEADEAEPDEPGEVA